MKKLLLVLLSMLLCLTAFAGCQKETDGEKATADTAVADAAIDDIAVYQIETKYGNLSYPKEWKDKVHTEILQTNGYIVIFSTGVTKLFELQFNCGSGDVLGTLTHEGENVVVRVAFAELNKKSLDYESCVKMQNAVDVIVGHLVSDYGFAEGEEMYVNTDDVYEIKTDVLPLYYPAQWQDVVTVDVSGEKAAFSCGDVRLFDIVFGDSAKGTLLGSCDGTDVYAVSYDIERGELSDGEYTRLLAMQESIDTVIEGFGKTEGFRYAD